MRRLTDDRGAVGVLVAVLLVPMLLLTALVVDVGTAYVERRQLQNAADAAALAVAADCGRGACGNTATTATTLAAANVGRSGTTAIATVTGHQVTVRTSGPVDYTFAPLIGIRGRTVGASSTAGWGAPTGGRSVLPLAFSWCSFQAQTGGGLPTRTTPTTILFPKTDATACTGPSGNPVPGGFAWLTADSGGCWATTSISTARVYSDPGRSAPSSCSAASFAAVLNRTVLLPVFDTFGLSGSNAWYHVYAYAAFRVTGYNFGGQNKSSPAPCSGNDSCIAGYFTVYVEPSQGWTYGAAAPDLGARLVTLVA
ncbi:pilus assembly protein TadG-related protein [Nakamurella endophytica]|uniref:Putative Flp pilus-assembly TadG-like N-terminal domain-containing protein n=1 Tax=Nakamurella endophytica TaxID=1748367 RepID=A0A917WBL8_9ACTN|nr:pilus assembly protein TadG-related protein [Nakamurella endophytica]GGL88896.1 hypothetical protein GCM10011594_05700 [Nakamurella endophytica]